MFRTKSLPCAIIVMSCACQTLRGPDTTATSQTLEAGCASCIFEMQEVTGCKLALRMNDRSHLVRGFGIDDFGDAHADDGLCNTSRTASVLGRIEGDWFVATEFKLLP